MAKTRFSRRKKVKKPKFDVSFRKTDEYVDSHVADHIEDLILGPCCDKDRDAQVFSEFHFRDKDEEAFNVNGALIIEHAPEVLQFLAACPHLDPTHALILLEDHTMEEAIKIGKTQIMTPRGMVPKWMEVDLEDPLDQKFKLGNAKIKKMEREKLRLGEDYVPGPVRKIKDIEKEMLEAQDPAKIEECYTKIVWPVVMEPEIVPVPKKIKKAKRGKAKSKKDVKLETKKVIKYCKKSLNANGFTPTPSASPKAKRGRPTLLSKKKVIKYMKKETEKGLNSVAGLSSVDGCVSQSTSSKLVVKPVAKTTIKSESTKSSTKSNGPANLPKVATKRGSPGKENVIKIEKVEGAKKGMKAKDAKKKKPVLNE